LAGLDAAAKVAQALFWLEGFCLDLDYIFEMPLDDLGLADLATKGHKTAKVRGGEQELARLIKFPGAGGVAALAAGDVVIDGILKVQYCNRSRQS